jgi:uncharacterized protein with PQ loop repeat
VSGLDVPVAAGTVATAVFAISTLPMLVKAHRTKDVGSYSLGNIALGNVGNLLYTVYVLHLPAGPIWALHTFHTVSTALMLFWYLRYVLLPAAGDGGWRGHFGKLVPGEQVVEVLEFETEDPALRGTMTMTTTLTDSGGGTEVLVVHAGIPDGVPAADNELGARMALANLARLVERDPPA